jgi:isopenicillin N synthase-like dioxygenase
VSDPPRLPVIDVAPLVARDPGRAALDEVARRIAAACRQDGFFYAVGHGVDPALRARLEDLARAFFARPDDAKRAIAMARGGRAWRGWFPVGGELTSGVPDRKEGLYFGEELGRDDPRVRAGTPLHGPNLFPGGLPGFREAVLGWMAEMTRLAQAITGGIALSLGLPRSHFADGLTAEPLVLFRIFHYPPVPHGEAESDGAWGVGEHTDYGLLTILAQDDSGGLEVRRGSRWIDAPPVDGAFVCNIGDMLDRLTGGWFRSTPHRVRNVSGQDRLSFPLFFDPDFAAEIKPLPRHAAIDSAQIAEDRARRWDGASVHSFTGTYGDYLLSKVAKVFPQLKARVL